MDRLAFNFLKSYYEVYKRLPDDASKARFVEAICEMQFYGKEVDLDGIVEFAYASQKHSIEKSRLGWEDVQKRKTISLPSIHPSEGASEGASIHPSVQEKEKEEVQEKEKEEEEVYRAFDHLSLSVKDFNKLNDVYTKESIDRILDGIENYAKNKNYKSLYLTANKWLLKDGVKKVTEQEPYCRIPR